MALRIEAPFFFIMIKRRHQYLVATCILLILVWLSQQHERGYLVLAVAMLGLPMLDSAWRLAWLRRPVFDLTLVAASLLVAWLLVSSG